MTMYYLCTESDEEVRALSCGIVPERVREMARACLDWELDDVRKAEAEQRIEDEAKAAKPKKRRSA